MNAPYERALLNADCAQRTADPVEASKLRPDSVLVSSRSLGWKYLNIERREVARDPIACPAALPSTSFS